MSKRYKTEATGDPAANPLIQLEVEENVHHDVCISMKDLESINNTEAQAQRADNQNGISNLESKHGTDRDKNKDGNKNDIQRHRPVVAPRQTIKDSDKHRPRTFHGFEQNPSELAITRTKPRKAISLKRDVYIDESIIIKPLDTQLFDAIKNHDNEKVKRLLQVGTNPDGTYFISHILACHVAAYSNNGMALTLLLKLKAGEERKDDHELNFFHFAAWAESNLAIAVLLGFPEDLQKKISLHMTPEIEEEVELRSRRSFDMINVPVGSYRTFHYVSLAWNSITNFRYRFEPDFNYRRCMPGWPPLHIASYLVNHTTTRLLLAAGADPNFKDAEGQTSLDVAGGFYIEKRQHDVTIVNKYANTIKALIEYGGTLNKPLKGCALRTAVEMGSIVGIKALLAIGAPVNTQDTEGDTILHKCVKTLNKEYLKVFAMYTQPGETVKSVDLINTSGYTVLHAAILASWLPGVCITLEAEADVNLQDKNGYTAVHLAARKGNVEILKKVLEFAKLVKNNSQNAVNDTEDEHVESPLLCAIRSGNLDCVKKIIESGWGSLQVSFYIDPERSSDPHLYLLYKICKTLPIVSIRISNFNMIVHAMAEIGHVNILKYMLDLYYDLNTLLHYKCPCFMNMIPVEYAAFYNRFDTFKFLLKQSREYAFFSETIFTPSRLLDIISCLNREDMYYELISQIPDAVRIATENRHHPLHNAIKNCNRNVILHMIDNGADLSQSDDFGDTPICLLMEHISKPTEFIESIFDGYIKTNNIPIQNRDCVVTVDYRVLMPPEGLADKGDLRVVKALLEHDLKNQRKLLGHPLVESFLYLKWKTLSMYFYFMALLYMIFVVVLTGYIVSVFYYKDDKKKLHVLAYFDPTGWRIATYIILVVVVIQEFVCFNVALKAWTLRIHSLEFWIKLLTYVFATATVVFITIESDNTEWLRYLPIVTLVLASSFIMMVLSKAPETGYYMHMFWNVSFEIAKILLIFSFLIIMFSFCFMVQFHSQEPFDGPLTAVVKTFVMITSEFDYGDKFSNKNVDEIGAPVIMLRIVFVVFMVLIAIVLMNLMTGVAVHDVQDLIQDGNLRRIEKQLEFLDKFDISRRKKSLYHKFSLYKWFNSKKLDKEIKIKPVNDGECSFDRHIKEMLLKKLQKRLNEAENEAKVTKNESKLDEILQAITVKEQNIIKIEKKLEDILQTVTKNKEQFENEINLKGVFEAQLRSKLDEILQNVTINKLT